MLFNLAVKGLKFGPFLAFFQSFAAMPIKCLRPLIGARYGMKFGFAIAIVVLMTACNSAELVDRHRAGEGKLSSTEGPSEGEKDRKSAEQGGDKSADEPVMVGGAFLVKCEVLSQVTPDDGASTVGCAVIKDGVKFTGAVDESNVNLKFSDGAVEAAKVSAADAAGPYHATFELPKNARPILRALRCESLLIARPWSFRPSH